MATDLTGLQVRNTYNSLLKIGDNTSLTGIAKRISDGLGNDSPLFISTSQISIGVAPATGYDLTVNSGIRTGSIDVLGAATAQSLQFTGGGGTQGTMSWNTDEETVDLIQNGATLQLGQETHVHVKNQSGATINDGTPVYVTGTLGASGRLTVAPMIADGSIEAKYFLGVTTEDIPNGEDGKVTTFGKIRGLNTSAYAPGTTLYVSSTTAGFWQTTPPVSPALDLEVAIVINQHANNGTLFVRANNGQYLGMLHDVYLNSVADNQLLVYNATNSRWENQGIASIGAINLDTVTDNGNTTTNSISVGDINAGNVTLTGYLRGAANFVIDPAAHGDETGVVQILGDLRVDGTTTTINSTTVTINDKNIVLAQGSALPGDANGAGITIDGAAASMTYNSTSDRFVFNKDIETNLVGNVTGDLTGNADTASALAASVNIEVDGAVTGNADFDGSGDITITTTVNHNHDDRYYTETESDNRFVNVAGDTMTGDLDFNDGVKAKFGTGDDLTVYHNATNSLIDNATGSILIRNLADDQDIVLVSDDGAGSITDYLRVDGSEGSVKLFHYGSEKLVTTATGVSVTGAFSGNLDTSSISGSTIDINGTTRINLQYNGTTQAFVDSTGFNISGGLALTGVDGISLTDEDSTTDSYFHANTDYDAGIYTVTSNARYGADYIQVDGLDSRSNTRFTISPKDIGDPDPFARLYIGGDNSNTAPNTLVDWHTIYMNALSVRINNNEVATQSWVASNIDLQDVTDNGATTTNGITVANMLISATAPLLDFVDTNSFTDANDRFRIRAAGDVGQIRWYDDSASTDTVLVTFNPNGNVSILGTISGDGSGLTKVFNAKAELGSAEDLDNFRTTGYMSQNSNSQAAAGTNYPTAFAGILEVINDDTGNGVHTVQRYSRYDSNDVYTRYYYNGGWQSWTRFLTTSDEGSGNGLDADTVDGLHASSFLRSDADDEATGFIVFDNNSGIRVESGGSTPDATTGTYQQGVTLTGGNMRLNIDVSDVTNGGAYIQTRHQSSTYPNATYDLKLNPLGGDVEISNATMIVKPSGTVSIGTTATDYPLNIQANSGANAIRIIGRSDNIGSIVFANNANDTNQGFIQSRSDELRISPYAGSTTLYSGSGERINVNSDGIIYMARVSGKPTIKGNNLYDSHLIIDSGSSADAVWFQNYNSGNVYMVTGGGSVGIGLTSVGYKLHVNGDAKVETNLTVGDSGQADTYLYLLSSTSGTSNLRMGDTDTDAGAIIYDNGSNQMKFRTNAGNRVFINSDGRVGINKSDPGVQLDVAGAIRSLGSITDTSGAVLGTYSGGTDLTASAIILGSDGKTGWGPGDEFGSIRWYNTDGSGIGARDAAKIVAWNATGNGVNTTTFSGQLSFYTSAYNNLIQENLRLTYTGNMVLPNGSFGIGISAGTTPSDNLIVSGDAYITGGADYTLKLGRPSGKPSIKAETDDGGFLLMDSNGGVVGLNWYTSDDVVLCSGGGDVGIGLSSPEYKLDVSGDIRATTVGNNTSQTRDKLRVWSGTYTIGFKDGYTYGSLSSYAMSFQVNTTSGRGWWWGTSEQSDAQGCMALDNAGNLTVATAINVGEGTGTTAPYLSMPLNVNGRARITDDLFLGDVLYHDGDTNTYMQFLGDRIRFYAGGVRMLDMIEGTADRIIIPVDVSIANTADPAYALDVGGTIRASGDVIAYSDARVKENVKTIDNALDKVTQLRGVSYNKIGETEEKIGVIAQEIEKVLPQVVQEDDEGMKSVAYGNIVGVLIESIKELKQEIDELKAKLNA